jgi:putative spermidine/putrescine transport system ATP-binding protein
MTNVTAAIELDSVCRRYGDVKAVDNVSVAIQPGEFFSLLGPSGSGKTTCLRLIAGFEHPSSGIVRLAGRDVSNIPPYERDVNTVFQDYALFPHLSVIENVEYGLRAKGVVATKARQRAGTALEQVALSGYGERKPSQLSGGQRQRVALARAIVNKPSVLLLDEPLGALDLRLREKMQVELKKLHRQLGISFVYVTHDQGEAMSMSDRVAVFANGRIEQVDSPRELYQKPATTFVAEFVGGSNILRDGLAQSAGAASGSVISIRPEQIQVFAPQAELPAGHAGVRGILADIQYHGATYRYEVDIDGHILTAEMPSLNELDQIRAGEPVQLAWLASHAVHLKA